MMFNYSDMFFAYCRMQFFLPFLLFIQQEGVITEVVFSGDNKFEDADIRAAVRIMTGAETRWNNTGYFRCINFSTFTHRASC